MSPWAGRVRDGRFDFDGRTHRLPLNLPPHSAHGVGFVNPWRVVDPATIEMDLTEPWPFAGRLRQTFELHDDRFEMNLTVEADETMPAMLGWHPWFERRLLLSDGTESDAELEFGRPPMYELDDVMIPTGELVACPDGPWDNCFTGLDRDPVIRWPGALEIRLTSTCDHWVVYTEPNHALCVEPQSAAPDAFNRAPTVIEAGESMTHRFSIHWRLD